MPASRSWVFRVARLAVLSGTMLAFSVMPILPTAVGAAPAPRPNTTNSTGSRTSVPDYDIDPLLLQRLDAQLSEANKRMAAAKRAYADGLARVAIAEQQASELRAEADQAQASADAAREVVREFVRDSYLQADVDGFGPTMTAIVSAFTPGATPTDVLDAAAFAKYAAQAQARHLAGALATLQRATSLSAAATAKQADVEGVTAQLSTAYQTAAQQVTSLTASVSTERARIAKALLVTQQAERARGTSALTRWNAYLAELNAARVDLPTAAQLRDPRHLPAGLLPVLSASGQPQPGTAKIHTPPGDLLVLPAEVIAAIDYALTRLGDPYVFGATGPTTFDCSGLTSTSYLKAGLAIPRTAAEQYHFTSTARIAPGQEQPGDLVFFVADGTPVDPGHVAMVLDPQLHLMIQAPQTGDVVKISDYSQFQPLGFGRPSLVAQPDPAA